MNFFKFFPLFIILFISCSHDDGTQKAINKQALQQQLNAAVEANRYPGLSLSVKSASESFTLVAGQSAVNETQMNTNALHYMQSISKTFTAVAILKLKEQGKINLDAPIKNYLPSSICDNLANGNIITVRQLLNMTSGLPDYLDNESFINDVMAGPLPLSSSQILNFCYGKPAHFNPGTSFGYANINYHLLALIIDSVTENGHRDYITTQVINSSELKQTYYVAGSTMAEAPAGTDKSYLVNGTTFEDVSMLQFGTVLSFIGDDGIIATAADISDFYYKLLHDKSVLNTASLTEMKTAVQFQGQALYGLGLHFYTSGNSQAIGHEGSGAGAGAYAFYFPSQKISVTLCTNTGTLTDPEKEQQLAELWQQLTAIILNRQ